MNPFEDELNGLLDVPGVSGEINFGQGTSYNFSYRSHLTPQPFYLPLPNNLTTDFLPGLTRDSAYNFPAYLAVNMQGLPTDMFVQPQMRKYTRFDEALGLYTDQQWIAAFKSHFFRDEEKIIKFRKQQNEFYRDADRNNISHVKDRHIALINEFRRKGEYPLPPLPISEKTLDELLQKPTQLEQINGEKFYRFGAHLLIEETLCDKFIEGTRIIAARSPMASQIICGLLDDVQRGVFNKSNAVLKEWGDQVDTRIVPGNESMSEALFPYLKISWNVGKLFMPKGTEYSPLSPIEILYHELAHNYYNRQDELTNLVMIRTPVTGLTNYTEKIVILGSEKVIRNELEEAPRYSHKSGEWNAVHVASTEIRLAKSDDGKSFTAVEKDHVQGRIIEFSSELNSIVIQTHDARLVKYKLEEICLLLACFDSKQCAVEKEELREAYLSGDEVSFKFEKEMLFYLNLTEMQRESSISVAGEDSFPDLTLSEGSISLRSSEIQAPNQLMPGKYSLHYSLNGSQQEEQNSQLKINEFSQFNRGVNIQPHVISEFDLFQSYQRPDALLVNPVAQSFSDLQARINAYSYKNRGCYLGSADTKKIAKEYLEDPRGLPLESFLEQRIPKRLSKRNNDELAREEEMGTNDNSAQAKKSPRKKSRR